MALLRSSLQFRVPVNTTTSLRAPSNIISNPRLPRRAQPTARPTIAGARFFSGSPVLKASKMAYSNPSSEAVAKLVSTPFPSQSFVNGQWIKPQAYSGSWDVINPATEEPIVRVDNAGRPEVDAAVKAARDAFENAEWSRLPGTERAKFLRAIAAKLNERKAEIAAIESYQMGKPYSESELDVGDSASCFEYFAGLADKLDSTLVKKVESPDAAFETSITREPLGVVGAIVPWNYPLLMATWKVAPALAAGCTMVLKPSEYSPLTVLELARIANEVGVPKGVFNVVVGAGASTGDILAQHPGFDKLAFTGSVPTGSKIMSYAARNIQNIALELGGKSPAIVFDDIKDLDNVVEWIMFGCFWTNGQICSATSRLLVQEKIADQFLAKLSAEVNKLKLANPHDPKFKAEKGYVGPVVSKAQYDRVLGFINGAVAEGAKVLAGGNRSPAHDKGYFIQPTVLLVKPHMTIWKQEVFGPVLSVHTFKDEADAVSQANDSEYGLGGAVFSSDDAKCKRVSRNLRVGISWINCSQPSFSSLPWGGYKKSGIGRELSEEGLEAYFESKQVVAYKDPSAPLSWYPRS